MPASSDAGAGNLLMFARDPGNANQIVALGELVCGQIGSAERAELLPGAAKLVEELSSHRTEVNILFAAEGPAVGILDRAGFAAAPDMSFGTDSDIPALLTDRNVTTVGTGLSDRDDRTPQALWHAAKFSCTRSVAIADDNTLAHPDAAGDLAERFTDSTGHRVLPDLVCVVDNESKAALRAIDVPGSRIRILGNLHLRRFRRLAKSVDAQAIAAVRRAWGVSADQRAVMFASEPLSQMHAFGKKRDYDELHALEDACARINRASLLPGILDGHETVVVVRPHPRDATGKFSSYLDRENPRVVVLNSGSSVEAILAADVVAGITSMLLVEAAALNKPSISMIDFDPEAAARGA